MATRTRVPDYLLERMKAGELSASKTEELQARLLADGEDDRLAELAKSDEEILAKLPPAAVAQEVERRRKSRVGRPVRRLRPLWTWSVAAACAASIAILVMVFSGDEDTRLKGPEHSPTLRIYRKTQAGSELLQPNAEVRQGDNLQIRYLAAGQRFGVIASIDGRDTVTLHLPESSGPAAALNRDGERALPHAYELDDSPRFERFVFVTSDKPFTTEEVARALRNGASLPRPFVSFEVLLRKSP